MLDVQCADTNEELMTVVSSVGESLVVPVDTYDESVCDNGSSVKVNDTTDVSLRG